MMAQEWCKPLIKNLLLGVFCIGFNSIVLAANSSSNEGIQVYQKNGQIQFERKINLSSDIDHYRNANNLWDTLRQDFNLPHYEDNPLVQQKIDWYLNHQDFLFRSMTRAAPYLYFILQQVKKRHLPAELVLLPIIESAYNPFALNASSGASGIWQMMSATASGYGIRQNWWYDGRRDVVASTKAALNHLAYLKSFFEGNWLLAIAAYDTGEGNVLSAISRNIRNGENTSYWTLPLAQETRDYVPQLLALATIIAHPDEYPIQLPQVNNAPYLAQVDTGSQIDLKLAASFAGLSLKELKQLNPGYSRSVTDPDGPYKLILPIENVERFTANLSSSSFAGNNLVSNDDSDNDSLNTYKPKYHPVSVPHKHPIFVAHSSGHYSMQPGDTLYIARRGDSPEKIARHFRIPINTLLITNQLAHHAVHPGQQLIIPTHHQFVSNQHYQLDPGDTIYMVRAGDTIEKIANRYKTTPSAVRLANLLASNTLQEGDRLVIPTHV